MASALEFHVVIPARFASTRLPGKPLLHIAGKPLLQHTYERALSSGASQVLIATDDERIRACAEGFGASVVMTATTHTSGTDRIHEAVEHQGWASDAIVINLQGDEPLMPPEVICRVAAALHNRPEVEMATVAQPIGDLAQYQDSHVVKVVVDRDGFALYFSRAAIPAHRDGSSSLPSQPPLHHFGLYAYRAALLKRFVEWEPAPLELSESLEQLRVLYNGARIYVVIAEEALGHGVDTEEDLVEVARLLDQ